MTDKLIIKNNTAHLVQLLFDVCNPDPQFKEWKESPELEDLGFWKKRKGVKILKGEFLE